jgi:hypothetical protein
MTCTDMTVSMQQHAAAMAWYTLGALHLTSTIAVSTILKPTRSSHYTIAKVSVVRCSLEQLYSVRYTLFSVHYVV